MGIGHLSGSVKFKFSDFNFLQMRVDHERGTRRKTGVGAV